MFIVLTVIALAMFLGLVIGVAVFSQSSRHDWLAAPATDAQDRWSRRLAGVYVRDDQNARSADYGARPTHEGRPTQEGRPVHRGDDELVGR